MTNRQGDFIWYELMTTDMAGAKAFYDAVIGWDIQSHGMPSATGAQYHMIMRSDGKSAGGALALSDEMRAGGAQPGWLGYVAVHDVDAAAGKVEAAGGSVLMPPVDMPGVGRFALVADQSGAAIYVMTPTPPPGHEDAVSDVFSETEPQRCSWQELASGDLDAALALYCDLFGWQLPEPMDMGPNGKYHFIAQNGVTIGGAVNKPAEMPVSAWTYYFRVPSIPNAVTAVEARGGTVLMGPHPIPGGDHIIHGRDPQGAHFALVGGAE